MKFNVSKCHSVRVTRLHTKLHAASILAHLSRRLTSELMGKHVLSSSLQTYSPLKPLSHHSQISDGASLRPKFV